jgi:hypothetical protein
MDITNIAWCSDVIREFLFDLDDPKLKNIDFNDKTKKGIYFSIVGFVTVFQI